MGRIFYKTYSSVTWNSSQKLLELHLKCWKKKDAAYLPCLIRKREQFVQIYSENTSSGKQKYKTIRYIWSNLKISAATSFYLSWWSWTQEHLWRDFKFIITFEKLYIVKLDISHEFSTSFFEKLRQINLLSETNNQTNQTYITKNIKYLLYSAVCIGQNPISNTFHDFLSTKSPSEGIAYNFTNPSRSWLQWAKTQIE